MTSSAFRTISAIRTVSAWLSHFKQVSDIRTDTMIGKVTYVTTALQPIFIKLMMRDFTTELLTPEVVSNRLYGILSAGRHTITGESTIKFVSRLLRHIPPDTIISSNNTKIETWANEKVILLSGGNHDRATIGLSNTSLFCTSMSDLSDLLSGAAWESPIMYLQTIARAYEYEFHIMPVAHTSHFIGGFPPRLDLSEKLTTLLVGPSGSGKSTVIQEACRLSGKRLLKISSGSLRLMSHLPILMQILRPDVLLIEDCQDIFSDASISSDILQLLEHLNRTFPIVCTLMSEKETFLPGDLYFPGMRPGRLDKVVLMKPYTRLGDTTPSENVMDMTSERALHQLQVLRSYFDRELPEWLVKRLVNLSPAYLRAIAENIRRLPEDRWEEEVKYLMLTVPKRVG